MPVFAFPLAFIGLLAIPALVAIYWFRSRAKEYDVSSLLLWINERQMWEGGEKIHRLQTPLLFFLELLTILFLITAAAGPLIRASDGARPLVIVLDDSFSMLAGGEDSARSRAIRALEKELRSNQYRPIHFILAGESPQVLGETNEQNIKLLSNWSCSAPTAKLEEAIAFAFELGGSRARILAVSDHPPAQELGDSRLQWWAFGTSRPNTAFINATRTIRDDKEIVLLEIANLASLSKTVQLTIGTSGEDNSQPIPLSPNEIRRIVLTLRAGAPPLRARLSDDALGIDNEVVLMPETSRRVRVDLRVRDAALRNIIERAIQSLQNVSLGADKPELVIIDQAEPGSDDPEMWILQIVSEKDAASFLGPFVIDRAHPMSEGLSLGGVIWGSGKSRQFPGTPIITAGNIPLLTDIERTGKHELRLRLRPDLSTLQETPNWPILIWNLINWRAVSAPGLQQANVRLGSEETLKVATAVESVKVTDPKLNTAKLTVHDNAVVIKPQMIGVYRVETDREKYVFAANALEREESDLSNAATGRWGNWANSADLQWEYRSVAWIFVLLAMITLGIHAWLVYRLNKS